MIKRSMISAFAAALLSATSIAGQAQSTRAPASDAGQPIPHDGEFVLRDFQFRSGEKLEALRLHYTTLGTPARDAAGKITNAVLLIHGTVGSGRQYLRPEFGGELFGPGQPLDARHYYIILPDTIGNGQSSKPSDGLRMRFPHYDYADMVAAEHALVTQGLGVDHLRLVMGSSMGCMHTFLWGETWPRTMDALMALACLPVQITGRNRLFRSIADQAIRSDPDWADGNYKDQPRAGLRTAVAVMAIADGSPKQMQKLLPTSAAADAYAAKAYQELPGLDANNLLYQIGASRDYDPSANFGLIDAPLTWVNSADDFINPPELRIAENEVSRVRQGRFILLPITDTSRGHSTHFQATVWKSYLEELLARSGR